MFGFLKWIFGTSETRRLKSYQTIVDQVNTIEEEMQRLSDDELRMKKQELQERHKKGESLEALLPETYALVKNTCRRLVGTDVHISGYDQKWDMIPYDVQIIGAIAMFKNSIAEMQTGEGKTLTASMPLFLRALTGKPVHIVTVNDYLAKRDCQWMNVIFRWHGMRTAALTNSVPLHRRKEIYNCDVVYGTASEFGFDYLRDNSMALEAEDQVQRGHYFAIVDEIDSILIDEARTPLIISGPTPESRQMYGDLKQSVDALVHKQRDYCNKLATDAKKTLSRRLSEVDLPDEEKTKPTKEEEEAEDAAFRKLWLVSKGTPRNKILKRVMEDPDMRAEIDSWDLYFHSDQNKDEKAKTLADLYILIDERSSEYELTDKGINAWINLEGAGNSADDFEMLDLGYAYKEIDDDKSLSDEEKMEKKLKLQEEDANRKERSHNIRQMLRAYLLMERDVDYIVQGGKIIIIDENTGRPQPGRRFSDGLHQSIEAKEGVEIQQETQTYATITLQNYFRMYKHLAGMTGTAGTDAPEFKEIYNLEVLSIPTNKPCIRIDENDEIYMSEREKYSAILKDVQEIHGKGRPILIGTESVEISEKLSRIFKQNKIPHTVLNAKYHESEAEVVAKAGQLKAITIATNMAGRGTDIKLSDEVKELGGLYVLGTTRHQSRRIDRQLRGRCSRQGDPGGSKFFISFEDHLMRLFASPKLTSMLQRFRPPEGEPISAPILNRSIETAQKRVEQRNYMMRKHTLEYDDVMNKQRQEIYSFRNEALHSEKPTEIAIDLIEGVCGAGAEDFFVSKSVEGGWNPEGYRQWLMKHFPVSFDEGAFDDDFLEMDDIINQASEKIIDFFKAKMQREQKKIPENSEMFEEGETPQSIIQNAVRNLMIRVVDKRWQEHLLTMDHLRSDVTMRSVGQKDPLMEFKQEAFTLFSKLYTEMQEEIAHDIFRFEVMTPAHMGVEDILQNVNLETDRSLFDEIETNHQPQEEVEEKPTPVTVGPKVGRNDPCPCGSGKKYKKCCGQSEED